MCGLFGALSSHLRKDEIENVEFLGILSGTRGIDSTGICLLGHGKKDKTRVSVHKDIDNPYGFFSSEGTKKAIQNANAFAVLGHTRWATLGAINTRNAHPIEENGVILCHNGTIDKYKVDKNDPINSDSRELARRLARQDTEAVLKDAIGGHWAITYVDLGKRTINFVRNWYRPLAFMYNVTGTTLYWASETWMLDSLALRKSEQAFKDSFMMQIDTVHTFRFGSANCVTKKFELWVAPIRGPVNDKRSNIFDRSSASGLSLDRPDTTNVVTQCTGCRKWSTAGAPDKCECALPPDERTIDTSGLPHVLPKVSVPSIIPEKKPEQRTLQNYRYFGWKGEPIRSFDAFNKLKKGCAGCKANSGLTAKAIWFSADDYVCLNCYTSDKVVKTYLTGDKKTYESEFKQLSS